MDLQRQSGSLCVGGQVLLYYLDPGLASKLDDADFVPELYATAWLITLFSR